LEHRASGSKRRPMGTGAASFRRRLGSANTFSTFLLPSLTIRERATPTVRSRPSSVHMDSVWFQTDLMGNSEYCAEKSCRSTIHQSRTTGTQRTERQLLADAVYRPCGYDHLQKLDKSPSLPVSLAVGILRRTAHPSRRGQPRENCHLG